MNKEERDQLNEERRQTAEAVEIIQGMVQHAQDIINEGQEADKKHHEQD